MRRLDRMPKGFLALAVVLCACATVTHSRSPTLQTSDSVAILPIVNYTETPLAGLRAEAIAESLMLASRFVTVRRYPSALNPETLFAPVERDAVARALDWAQEEGLAYALTGSVEEWRYRVGTEGSPVVGLTLRLIEVQSGAVVWTATGSRTGWGRAALAGVAQKLLRELLAPLRPR